MNEIINIFEHKVFQGMAGTYIIYTIFNKEEIAQAMNYFLEENYGMQMENLANLNEEEQQTIIYEFHNWFLQTDIGTQRLLEKITQLSGIDLQISARH